MHKKDALVTFLGTQPIIDVEDIVIILVVITIIV